VEPADRKSRRLSGRCTAVRPHRHRPAASGGPTLRTVLAAWMGDTLSRLDGTVRTSSQTRTRHRMTGTESTAKAGEGPAGLEVDAWTDRFGRLLERHRGFWVRVGNWETRLLEDQLDGVVIDRPIYIAGLARSGSTILLEMLARHSDTATHRYRDFPIVPAPWAWSWFVDRAGKKEHVLAERAHRDRIKVSPESPEAFEEVLWMTFFPG